MSRRRITRTRQPSVSITNRDIFAGLLPSAGFDSVSRTETLAQAHASLWVAMKPRRLGVVADCTAHAAAGLISNSTKCAITKPMFISVVFEPTSANGDVLGLWNSAATTAAYAGIWTLNKNADALEFKYNDGTGTLKTWTIANVSLVAGNVYFIYFEVTANAIKCYSSGVLVDTLTWIMPTEGGSIVGSASMVFGKSSGNLGFSGYVYLGLVGRLGVSADYSNPWSMLAPLTRRIFVSAAGGGGGANWLTSGYWRNRNYGAE